MEKDRKVVLLVIFYALVIFVIHYFRLGGKQYSAITTIISYVSGIIPIYFGYLAINYFGLKTLQGKSVLFLTIAQAFWMLGDILWLALEIVGGTAAVSDIAYIAGYPMVLVGVYFGIKTVNLELVKDYKKIACFTISLLIFFYFYLNYFPASWDNEISFLENVVTYGYSIADLILLASASWLIFIVISGSFSIVWLLIGISFLINFLADIYYSLNYETYANGDLIDLGWYFAYLVYGLGLFYLRYNAEKALATAKEEMTKS